MMINLCNDRVLRHRGLAMWGIKCHAAPKNEWNIINKQSVFVVIATMMRLFKGICKSLDVPMCKSLIGVLSLKSCELSINE